MADFDAEPLYFDSFEAISTYPLNGGVADTVEHCLAFVTKMKKDISLKPGNAFKYDIYYCYSMFVIRLNRLIRLSCESSNRLH